MEGIRIGFEIHQQIDTCKLFCPCPSVLREGAPDILVLRRLRPVQSELGEIDGAAMQEFLKGRSYTYEAYADTTCLVELDEEPPHVPNKEAIDVALEVAMLLDMRVVEELHFMRKMVIDGSNTSGFQRTAIVAMDGVLETENGGIQIPTLCLEEEAARKMGEEGENVTYRLDRLGIPLVEVTTAPDIKDPRQAREVALKLGELLRATGKVRRGIGTIRQDLNVSVEGGARVEIKGVQDLNLIPKMIELEVERQRGLIEVAEKLKGRGADGGGGGTKDVTALFSKTGCKVIARQLEDKGVVLGARLEGYAGLLGSRECAVKGAKAGRLGPELAQHAKAASGIPGIFHSDELPAYGISEGEAEAAGKALGAKKGDAFVLISGDAERAKLGMEAVLRRARAAPRGVPEETRVARQDGATEYMRPLPGAARMYPETDIPPTVMMDERLERIKGRLPELYEERIEKFVKEHGISGELASQLVRSGQEGLFKEVVRDKKVPASVAASTLVGTLKELKRDGVEVERIEEGDIKQVFAALARGDISKEAIPELFTGLSKGQGLGEMLAATKGCGEAEVRAAVKKAIEENSELIKRKGGHAAQALMGVVMKEVRGKADGRLVSRVLAEELKKVL